MREIAPGLWHWAVRHERIRMDVSSYYLGAERVLIDPLVPAEGLSWFEANGVPEHVLLTNRHHDRHAGSCVTRSAARCIASAAGCTSSTDVGRSRRSTSVIELPGGVIAYEVDVICPDETALYIPAHRALACADGVVRLPGRDELGFVPDELMDDPEETKVGLRDAYRRLLDLDFEHLLLAHGEPVVTSGKEALRAFAH